MTDADLIERVARALAKEIEHPSSWEAMLEHPDWHQTYIERAQAAIAAYEEWQPIETAAEWGWIDAIVRIAGEWVPREVFKDGDIFIVDGQDLEEAPTHWRPRPAPPQESE